MNTTEITGWQLVANAKQYCEWSFVELDKPLNIVLSSYDEIQYVINSIPDILSIYMSRHRSVVLESIIYGMIRLNSDVSILRHINQLWPEIIEYSVDISSFNSSLDAEGYEKLTRRHAREKLLNGGN